MSTSIQTGTAASTIERRILGLRCEVWWAPADAAYIACSPEFPTILHSDPSSALAAMNGLENDIRDALAAVPAHASPGELR
ncbi:hypothetical protein [Nocardia sp. alder85J]|uniref:hypothetical protein n=1 Tax=Nocardia sp. alder85J TaxID=2862949 RepID=UPI001CD4DD45|nr:hypothetical protein [Nocardia sp. alder85J]MCX4092488.1 hypothetical protein [Nocardia sp. alder85J]